VHDGLGRLPERGVVTDRPAGEADREEEEREEHPEENLGGRAPRIPASRARHGQEAIDSDGATPQLAGR
jgi:hypothetical protein